jgi:hypothetical protein|tara:strand:+ start:5095 stop:5775 length:681 start_codon:yes stop_codon:yes gene_type:complete
MVGAHPKVRLLALETRLFNANAMGYFMFLMRCPNRRHAAEKMREYFENKVWRYRRSKGKQIEEDFSPNTQEILDRFIQKIGQSENPYEAMREFVDGLLMDDTHETFVEKTPFHSLNADDIRRVYPDAIFLIPHRPFKDVCLSMKKVPWGPKEPEDITSYVKYSQEFPRLILKDDPRTIWFEIYDVINSVTPLIEQMIQLGLPQEGTDEMIKFYNEKFDSAKLLQYQ